MATCPWTQRSQALSISKATRHQQPGDLVVLHSIAFTSCFTCILNVCGLMHEAVQLRYMYTGCHCPKPETNMYQQKKYFTFQLAIRYPVTSSPNRCTLAGSMNLKIHACLCTHGTLCSALHTLVHSSHKHGLTKHAHPCCAGLAEKPLIRLPESVS